MPRKNYHFWSILGPTHYPHFWTKVNFSQNYFFFYHSDYVQFRKKLITNITSALLATLVTNTYTRREGQTHGHMDRSVLIYRSLLNQARDPKTVN